MAKNNLLEEYQLIKEDYEKCKSVLDSCLYSEQLTAGISTCSQFVKKFIWRNDLHTVVTKFGIFTDIITFQRNHKMKLTGFINSCGDELEKKVAELSETITERPSPGNIGFISSKPTYLNQRFLKVESEIEEWSKKKESLKDVKNLYEDL